MVEKPPSDQLTIFPTVHGTILHRTILFRLGNWGWCDGSGWLLGGGLMELRLHTIDNRIAVCQINWLIIEYRLLATVYSRLELNAAGLTKNMLKSLPSMV